MSLYFDNLGRVIQSLISVWNSFKGEEPVYWMLAILVWVLILLAYLAIPVMLYLGFLLGGHWVLKHFRYDPAAESWGKWVGFPLLLTLGSLWQVVGLAERLIRQVVWFVRTPIRHKAYVELGEIFMVDLSNESVGKTQRDVDKELHRLALELDQWSMRSRAIQTFHPENSAEQSASDREKALVTVEMPGAQAAFWRAYDVAERCGYRMKEMHPAGKARSHKAYLTAEELLTSRQHHYFDPVVA